MKYDVVVIGSGFGGSSSANRLALAGLNVLVLERGPWRDSLPVRSMAVKDRSPFPYGLKFLTHFLRGIHVARSAQQASASIEGGVMDYFRQPGFDILRRCRIISRSSKYVRTLNVKGLYEIFLCPGMDILCASAVGGGSHLYAGMLVTPKDKDYWRGRHAKLKPAQIEQYYDKILADMGAVPLSPEHAVPTSVWTQLSGLPGGRCKPADPQPYMAMKFPYVAGKTPHVKDGGSKVERREIAFAGDSFLGSKEGAKASVDFIYLAPVLGKGVTVQDLCEVKKIVRASDSGKDGYEVHFTDLRKKKTESIHAPRVILAAGTINTLRLLFINSEPSGGLNPMPRLGKTFGGNGDFLSVWHRDANCPDMFHSPPCLGRFLADGQESPFMVLGGLAGIDTLPLSRLIGKKLKNKVMALGMGPDSGETAIRFDQGRLVLDYPWEKEPIFHSIREALRALEADSGQAITSMKKAITVHQWGGARIGPDPDHGVVDHNGEVYGNPGLFVADGAALPAAPGTPPSLTIAAWAHHVADRLAQRSP
jgi:cholesterol oxidase